MAKQLTRVQLEETVTQQAWGLELLTERLAELELSLEDQGWQRLSGEDEREFSREGLRKICQLSRYNYLKSPLINRAVNVQAHYVWGQGVNIRATDEAVNDVVQAFLDDPRNRAELTSHQARTLKEVELQVLGNIFFCFFVSATGGVVVRTIPVDEIVEIICNPEDAKEPWLYKRVWTERGVDGVGKTRTAYYPDWQVDAGRPEIAFLQGLEQATPVYHVKVGGLPDMRFGVPETYQALDWAKAYKAFLEDRATVARALSRFAWRVAAPGGKAGVAAAKAKLATTIGVGSGETNPPPAAGSAFVAGAGGASLDPIRTSGATINPEEGRRFLLMVAAAMGLPETFFGDVSVGTLATATSLDRPTELKMADRRALWTDVLTAILGFVIEKAATALGSGITEATDRHVDVDFPALLEHDPDKRITSIIAAATLDGKTPVGTMDARTLISLLLQTLGVDDVDELLDKLAPENGESLMDQMAQAKADQAAEIAGQQAQARQANAKQQGPPDQTATEAAMVEAVRELREAVAKVLGS